MKMLNNKGQSLVMFVLIIPLMLLIMILVVDVGNTILNKQELDNINYLTIEYGLENIDKDNLEDNLINMIKINNKEIDYIDVYIKDNRISINLKKEINGTLAKRFKLFEIESNYIGYFKNGSMFIERV